MQRHAFTVIVENCNAENYVSEKIYAAFIAGSIPLYYGAIGEVPIPNDMYIDIQKSVSSSAQLQNLLDSHDVDATRREIYQQRESLLKQVSTGAFSLQLDRAVSKEL